MLLTGYHRNAAIQLLRKVRKLNWLDICGRPKIYTNEMKAALTDVREISGQICSKCLAVFLPEIVAVLEREGELKLPPAAKRLLVRMV